MLAANSPSVDAELDENEVISSILTLPLSGISPFILSIDQISTSIMMPNFEAEAGGDALEELSGPEQDKLLSLISSTDFPNIRIWPEFECNRPLLAKQKKTSLLDKIERACQTSAFVKQTGVSTAQPAANQETWISAPDTPVSEAWETQSGPMARLTPIHTPIRKVILKLTPKPNGPAVKPKEKPTPKNLRFTCVAQTENTIPAIDIEVRLSNIDQALAGGTSEDSLLASLDGMRTEFEKDSVAVKEWLLVRGAEVLSGTAYPKLRTKVCELTLLFFSSCAQLNGTIGLIKTCLFLLPDCLSSVSANSVVSLLGRVELDDIFSLRIASRLLKACHVKESQKTQIALLTALAVKYPEVKELLFAEVLTIREADKSRFEVHLLCSIVMGFCTEQGRLDEAAVTSLVNPVVEELIKRFSTIPVPTAELLSSFMKGLPRVLAFPELLSSPFIAKVFVQLGILTLTSDKLKLDVHCKQVILEALIEVVSFLRPHDLNGELVEELSSEYFYGLNLPNRDQAFVLAHYAKLYNVQFAPNGKQPVSMTLTHTRLVLNALLSPICKTLVNLLIRLSTDSNASLKTKAFRGLASILNRSDPLLEQNGFLSFLQAKCHDNCVAVRDTALEILTKIYTPKELNDFNICSVILSKTQDSSSLVRRRVIRIAKDLIDLELSPNTFAEIITSLLTLTNDEENSVSGLAKKILKEAWIHKTLPKIQDRQEIVNFVALIIRVIRMLDSDSNCIQNFLLSCLKDEGNDKERIEKIKELCSATVDILFESLIGSVESADWDAAKFILRAIEIFVGTQHSYLETHLRLLFELSKSSDMVCVNISLRLMKLAIKDSDVSSLLRLTGCGQLMATLISKGSEPVVKGAIEFLYLFAVKTGSQKLMNQLIVMWRQIYQCLIGIKNYEENLSAACRGIFSLGCFLKCNLECPESLFEESFDFLMGTSKMPNKVVAFYAHQAISFVLEANSSMFLKKNIVAHMSTALGSNVQEVSLAYLRSLLVLTQNSSNATGAENISFATSMNPSEVNLAATAIQCHIDGVIHSAYVDHPECQMLALKLLSIAVVNGLCHPQQSIPTILALSTSPIEQVRSKAAEVVRSLIDTHAGFLFTNYASMFESIYRIQALGPEAKGYSLETNDSWLAQIYSEIRGKKLKRQDLIAVLIMELDNAFERSKLSYAVFLAEMVAVLPFKTNEEVACLFSKVNDLALSHSCNYLESDDGGEAKCEFERTLLYLELRQYLAANHGMSTEKLERIIASEPLQKAALQAKEVAPFAFAFEIMDEDSEVRKKLISDIVMSQKWIDTGLVAKIQEPRASMIRAAPKKAKKRRRARSFNALNSGSESDVLEEDIY